MVRGLRIVLSACLAGLALAASAQAAGLKAGVAKVEITPPVGEKMWGYSARKEPAKGVLDPLYARVLVLEVGEKKLSLVVLDFH